MTVIPLVYYCDQGCCCCWWLFLHVICRLVQKALSANSKALSESFCTSLFSGYIDTDFYVLGLEWLWIVLLGTCLRWRHCPVPAVLRRRPVCHYCTGNRARYCDSMLSRMLKWYEQVCELYIIS